MIGVLSVISDKVLKNPLFISYKYSKLKPNEKKGAYCMIKRELYMSRIRPFIGGELIKVMTGVRRSGKSVILELVKQELIESVISENQFVSINFEDMSYANLCTAKALHDEIKKD